MLLTSKSVWQQNARHSHSVQSRFGRSVVSDTTGVMLYAHIVHTRVTLNNNKFYAIFNFSRRKQPDDLRQCVRPSGTVVCIRAPYVRHIHTFYSNGAEAWKWTIFCCRKRDILTAHAMVVWRLWACLCIINTRLQHATIHTEINVLNLQVHKFKDYKPHCTKIAIITLTINNNNVCVCGCAVAHNDSVTEPNARQIRM